MADMQPLQVNPEFDLEEFMNFSRETRISSEALDNLGELWADWQKRLKAMRIAEGKDSWLAIWLPETVETEVDEAWAKSPGEGFLINCLAQYMCMAATGELLPQIAEACCAPAPLANASLMCALDELALSQPGRKDLSIQRRYAILTYYPFRGGCEICALSEDCPKHGGGAGVASVVLPGYER